MNKITSILDKVAGSVSLDSVELGEFAEVGIVQSVKEGIVRISGLYNAFLNEVISFDSGEIGIIRSLEEFEVVVVAFNEYKNIVSGSYARRTNKMLNIPVSNAVLGRVLNAFGKPIDGGPDIPAEYFTQVEYVSAPTMIDRVPVSRSLLTGTIIVDAMISIGRGQRELIVGPMKTGKTSLAVGAIINQRSEYLKGKPVYCFYVAIGQSQSSVASVVKRLKDSGAMEYTTVICAFAADSVNTQFIVPYSGCAIAEYFMRQGNDCLIIYDDLSQHAIANRQIGRLIGAPGGRDAYPANSFYVHAQLLERAACTKNGTLTAIPIMRSIEGEFGDFITTNVVSITDGQIVLIKDKKDHNQMPPINVGLSVTRIGRAAQSNVMKSLTGEMRSEIAFYEDIKKLQAFAGDQLDESQLRVISEGAELETLFNQDLDELYSLSEQAVLLMARKVGLLKNTRKINVKALLKTFLSHIKASQKKLISDIEEDKLSYDPIDIIEKEVQEFRKIFDSSSFDALNLSYRCFLT